MVVYTIFPLNMSLNMFEEKVPSDQSIYKNYLTQADLVSSLMPKDPSLACWALFFYKNTVYKNINLRLAENLRTF